ncbi:tumor necrosis factor receptor superfamily member 5 [Engraulis encrasicolus]|uniref:tumor necrosis factor receptor superfamily member 5 n=1 Tax=Engraulis encrasicolus TaxID=184585 RepID=UPI002FCEA5FF
MGPTDKCEPGKRLVNRQCNDCPPNEYSAESNSLDHCQLCNSCSKSQHLRVKSDCTPHQNAVCECQADYFCTNTGAESCTHCSQRATCPLGQGAINTGSPDKDTECQPCPPGFYSDVTDYHSPCFPHTNCTGLVLKREGNSTADSVCEPVKMTPPSPCRTPTLPPHTWILPAGLWVGLIISVIVFAAYIYWKRRRQSRQTVNITDGHGGNISPALAPDILPPPPELKDYKAESTETPLLSCAVETSPNSMNCTCTLECDGGMSPIVTSPTSPMRLHPLAVACVPGGESLHSTVCHSEPQEDEWPHQ